MRKIAFASLILLTSCSGDKSAKNQMIDECKRHVAASLENPNTASYQYAELVNKQFQYMPKYVSHKRHVMLGYTSTENGTIKEGFCVCYFSRDNKLVGSGI